MTTEFNSDSFEHDYIIVVLESFRTELKTGKPVEQVIDKYAVQLTAFMNGQIVQAVRASKAKAPGSVVAS